jgi:hypothetical protein
MTSTTTTTTTLLLSPQQLRLHLQLKDLHENEKTALQLPQRDPLDDECKTADSETTTNSVVAKTTAPLSPLKPRCSILKYRTRQDSLLACYCSSNKQKEEGDNERRKVVFAKVEIREHAIIIGDNPGCCNGPPLSIDWPCEKNCMFDFEAYEANRPERRVRASMQMSKEIRIKLLKAIGYSYQDIVRLTKPVNIARAQRRHTIGTLQTQGLHESAENITRGLKNALTLGRRKRQERKFLEPYYGSSSSNTGVIAQPTDVVSDSYASSYADDDDDGENVWVEEDLSKEEEEDESTLDVALLDGWPELQATRTRSMVDI